ncbi:serine/threonine-protein kinase [Streptomyces sp. NPDC001876]|uniref:serine/threonine-protein kinase n=1 Tax=Streptomyces sp. NPDC001876 TaxID=3154402 RepID=UPI00332D7549
MQPLTQDDPTHLGPYWLLSRIGAGGMGRVYLGRHRDAPTGRLAAVKTIRTEIADSATFRARFAREVRAAQRVSDAWTATVLEADTEATPPWIATAYVAGPTLQQVVASDFGPLPSASAQVLANRMALALMAIHEAGIVHRDLKPSNVLLTPDGPKVIDFGIARALEGTDADTLSSTGSAAGSPQFMAPEQVRGQSVTTATDVFSLGCVLAYAATGRTPFGSAEAGVHALLFRIAYEDPDLAGVPESVADLVRQCLAKEPADRPSPARIAEWTETAPDGAWLPPSLLARVVDMASAPVPRNAAREPDRTHPKVGVLSLGVSVSSVEWDTELDMVLADSTTTSQPTEEAAHSEGTRNRRRRTKVAAVTAGVLVASALTYAWWPSDDNQRPESAAAGVQDFDFSGAWVLVQESPKPLFAVRMEVPTRPSSATDVEVELAVATADAVCVGVATARTTARHNSILVVTDFALRATSGTVQACGVSATMRFVYEEDGRVSLVDGEGSQGVDSMEADPAYVPPELKGIWEDDSGLRITIRNGGLGQPGVFGELTEQGRTCRWEAAPLAYEEERLSTTGAQPRAGSPRCPSFNGLYDYTLGDTDGTTLIRTSDTEATITELHRVR